MSILMFQMTGGTPNGDGNSDDGEDGSDEYDVNALDISKRY